MANADLALQAPTLGINLSGGGVQNTGGGDDNWIKLRDKSTGGTIANTPTVLDAIVSNGIVNIKEAPFICIAADFTLGSLTSAEIAPQFQDDTLISSWFNFCKLVEGTLNYSVRTAEFVYDSTTAQTTIYTFPNPGAVKMRLIITSTGVVTSSAIGVWVGRSFHSSMIPAIT